MNSLCLLTLLLTRLAGATAQTAGHSPPSSPVALLWPPSRDGSDGMSTTAPCGSWDGAIVRHEFPVGTYTVPLTASNETWITKLSISYVEGQTTSGDDVPSDLALDPKSNGDFETIFTGSFANVEKQCIAIASPGDVQPGLPATLQLQFHDDHDSKKVTHYVCSDIVFVSRKSMQAETPCSASLAEEVEVALHPPPTSKTTLPSHGSIGSLLALGAVMMFSYVSYAHILPRIRQRQKESGNALEMARMIT